MKLQQDQLNLQKESTTEQNNYQQATTKVANEYEKIVGFAQQLVQNDPSQMLGKLVELVRAINNVSSSKINQVIDALEALDK